MEMTGRGQHVTMCSEGGKKEPHVMATMRVDRERRLFIPTVRTDCPCEPILRARRRSSAEVNGASSSRKARPTEIVTPIPRVCQDHYDVRTMID